MRDHPLRQPAIGRDHGHAAFRHGQRLAHQDGNGLCFFLGMGAVHQAHARQPPVRRRQVHPGRAGLWRQEQVGNGAAACGRAAAIPARCQLRTSSRARPMRCSNSFR
jgi:hypothetical protein